MIKHVLTALILTTSAAQAEGPMTGAEFDAYTKGKTLFYGQSGQPYGAEVYLNNRRVQWSFLDGICKDGFWYERDGHICFEYEDSNPDGPQCWTFTQGPNGLIAQFEAETTQIPLYEAQDVEQDLVCPGPNVGV